MGNKNISFNIFYRRNFLKISLNNQVFLWLIYWLILTALSTHLRLFYAYRLGNHLHCMFIFTCYFVGCFLQIVLLNTNNFETNIWPIDGNLQLRLDLGVIVTKWYLTLPRSPKLEPHQEHSFFMHILSSTLRM